jgi:hypothetical protein
MHKVLQIVYELIKGTKECNVTLSVRLKFKKPRGNWQQKNK